MKHTKTAASLALGLALMMPGAAEAGPKFDQLNGLWKVKLNGKTLKENALTESYPELGGVRLRFLGDEVSKRVLVLKKKSISGGEFELTFEASDNDGIIDVINGDSDDADESVTISLTTKGQKTANPKDDSLSGTFGDKTIELVRDMRSKPPIEIKMPGDRPWVRFMQEILIPKTAEDRETFHKFNAGKATRFLTKCQLYESGYWLKKYMKGEDRDAQKKSFGRIIMGLHNDVVSPRSMMFSDFRRGLDENLSEKAKNTQYGLAASGLGMYFSTAAGGAVRIVVTDNRDSIIYYITDTRRTAKLGLVVMDTPAHAPLASSFGRWLLDFGQMPKKDDWVFAKALLETLARSSSRYANRLSDVGKSAYCDYLGVMAIEDQRGVMFNNAGLKWGLNMTNASFTSLIARALSHGKQRKGPVVQGKEWLGLDGREELDSKVLVQSGSGYELRPGEPSYFDTLNGAQNVLKGGLKGGNDLQERGGMRKLKELTTDWLRKAHPEKVKRVEAAFAVIMPVDEISQPSRAKRDIFHLMSDYFYEPKMAKCTTAQAKEMVNAGYQLLRAVRKGSAELETFLLAQDGISKSDEWAPRASGF